jgi:nucleotide-binding universal stress UspA family protein
MRSVLLPVDGSDSAFNAARYVIDFIKKHRAVEVHVVNVQPKPLEWQTHEIEKAAVDAHLAIEAHISMKPVLHALDEEGIAHQTHIELGDVAETVVTLAEKLGCDHIVMGTRGLGVISGIALGSVARKVLHLANLPVTCVRNGPAGR